MALFKVERSLQQARWVTPSVKPDVIEILCRTHGLPEIIARLLIARGIGGDEVAKFLDPKLSRDFPDPMTMAGMSDAAAAIADSIVAKRGIGVFGDFDVDGATSTAILVRFLRHCGIDAPFHIPDRLTEGYGPNIAALKSLKDRGAGLVILADCGITAHEVIAQGKAQGLSIIVLDHHQAEEKLPPADHVVNPNRRDDTSGLGMLAACGVAFLTCVAVNGVLRARGWFTKTGRAEAPLKDWLDIVALGTVCDMVPLTFANRLFIRFGLQRMAQTTNEGIKALRAVSRLDGPVTPYQCGFALGPRINAGSRVHQADLGARLLCTDDAAEAREIAGTLDACNERRKEIQAEMMAQAERLVEDGRLHERTAIIVAHPEWHPGLVGLVAGRLREKYDRPALAVAYTQGEGRGSGRSVPGVNLGAAFIDARNAGLALKGGGHAMAAGFTITPDKLESFSAFVLDHIARQAAGATVTSDETIDGVLTVRGATLELARMIADRLGPFGQGHEEPLFVFPHVRVHMADRIGTDHVRCMISDWEAGPRLKAVAFRAADTALGQALLNGRDRAFHLCGRLKLDSWNGEERVELHIEDGAFAVEESARLTG